MNSYELSRNWFDWCFENPEKISPNHTALYFFIIEHCNRLGWKEKFGLPTTMAKEAIGIRSYNTYINTLNDLVEFGVINLIEKSKNQYSSNIIAISNFNKADSKALDKAFINHATKQSESTSESIGSIDKQITNNKETIKPLTKVFNFKNDLFEISKDEILVNDFMLLRKNKKATNSETAFNLFLGEVNKSKLHINEILKLCISRDWKGFNHEWLQKTDFKPKFEPKEDRRDPVLWLKKLTEKQENNILQIETPITPHQEI